MNKQWTFSGNFYEWEQESFDTRELAVEAAKKELEGEFGCLIAQLEPREDYECVVNVEEVVF